MNPTYTGRVVWNKQHKDEVLVDLSDVGAGYRTIERPSPSESWITSLTNSHPAIIDDDAFHKAQHTRQSGSRGLTPRRRTAPSRYLLRGLLHCGFCGRKMQGQVSHGRSHYRCRFPEDYALKPDDQHPRNVYLREDHVLHHLDQWLATVFDPDHLPDTAKLMAATDEPDPTATARQAKLRKVIADSDKSVGQYRKLLEAGGDPVDVAAWLAEAKAKRAQAERELADLASHRPVTATEIETLLVQVPDKVAMLAEADSAIRQRLYSELGLTLTYHPKNRVVRVEARPPWGFDRVEGET